MSKVDLEGRERDDVRDIEREIRDWTARPTTRTPRMARTRVLARIEERRARPGWMLAAAATALVAVLAVGLLLRGSGTPYEPETVAAAGPPAPSQREAHGTGLLVYELESGTKMYMALAVTTSFTKATMEGNLQ